MCSFILAKVGIIHCQRLLVDWWLRIRFDNVLIMVLDTIFVSFFRVYQLLGEAGTYYGVRFGKNLPWVTEFPFGYIKDPQYVGSILSLLACLCWVPFQYIFLWILGYVFMIWVESTEDPTTRAKPLNWFIS